MSKVGGIGVYNVVCQQCDLDYKSYELRKNWKGMWVCKDCWEPRHILDFYQTKPDTTPLPYITGEPEGADISPSGPFACGGPRTQGRADIGIADCARSDKDNY
jgi:hypothetical protein